MIDHTVIKASPDAIWGAAVNRLKYRLSKAVILVCCMGIITSGAEPLILRVDQDMSFETIGETKDVRVYEIPHSRCSIDECMMAPTRIMSHQRQSTRPAYSRTQVKNDIQPAEGVVPGASAVAWNTSGNPSGHGVLFSRTDGIMVKPGFGDISTSRKSVRETV